MVENGCLLHYLSSKLIKNHGTHVGTTFLNPHAHAQAYVERLAVGVDPYTT